MAVFVGGQPSVGLKIGAIQVAGVLQTSAGLSGDPTANMRAYHALQFEALDLGGGPRIYKVDATLLPRGRVMLLRCHFLVALNIPNDAFSPA
jgi:hypothetical protein